MGDREAVAHHEAGHFVVALSLGFKPTKVTIDADHAAGVAGSITCKALQRIRRDDGADIRASERCAVVCLAGAAAEARYRGHGRRARFGGSAASDVEAASDVLRRHCGHADEGPAHFRLIAERAKTAVGRNWLAIEAVAKVLVETPTMRGIVAASIARPLLGQRDPRLTAELEAWKARVRAEHALRMKGGE